MEAFSAEDISGMKVKIFETYIFILYLRMPLVFLLLSMMPRHV